MCFEFAFWANRSFWVVLQSCFEKNKSLVSAVTSTQSSSSRVSVCVSTRRVAPKRATVGERWQRILTARHLRLANLIGRTSAVPGSTRSGRIQTIIGQLSRRGVDIMLRLQFVLPVNIPAGTTTATLDLDWLRKWEKFLTNDLDMTDCDLTGALVCRGESLSTLPDFGLVVQRLKSRQHAKRAKSACADFS